MVGSSARHSEQMKRIKSPLFFNKMDELLNYPKVDPYGSPIPDKSGKINMESHSKLSDCKTDDSTELMAISDSFDFFYFFDQ